MSNVDFIPAGARLNIAAPAVSPQSSSVEESELGELPEVSCYPPPPLPASAYASAEAVRPIGVPPPSLQSIVGQGSLPQPVFPPPQQSGTTQAGVRKRSLQVISGTDIAEQSITWLWEGYLPSGKLTLLAGAGGTGKSTIAFSFASILTTAGTWPDGTQCRQPANVLIWSSEDDPADTIKPRLMAMGANQDRYFVIAGTRDEHGAQMSFDPANDIPLLREVVASIGGIALLVIDPIVSAVTGDMHKANDVRRSLQSIVDFAAECNCAVLGITHFAKGTAGKKSDERVIGSQAFSAFARMVLVAAKEEDSERRVFTRAKSNNSVDSGGFAYGIEPVVVGRGIIATRILWGESLEGSSRSILADVEDNEQPSAGAMGSAQEFLRRQLATGSAYATDVQLAADANGIAKITLRRAREAMKIRIQKDMDNGGKSRWILPGMPFDMAALDAMLLSRATQLGSRPPWSPVTNDQVT
jgi:hypothetical protein